MPFCERLWKPSKSLVARKTYSSNTDQWGMVKAKMSREETTSWDVVAHLETLDDIMAYFTASWKEHDLLLLLVVFGDMAMATVLMILKELTRRS